MMKRRAFLLVLVQLILATQFIACGKKPSIVKDVSLSSELIDEEVYLGVGTKLQIENVILPSLEIPIVNPYDENQTYGVIKIQSSFDGTSDISFKLNLSDSFHVVGGRAMLPNGTALPVGGLENVDIIELPIKGTQAKIYLALGKNFEGKAQVMAGFALSIKELDVVGNAIGGLNVFPAFNIKGVAGIAGIYTGRSSGQTGIALFLDASKVINEQVLDRILGGGHEAFAKMARRDLKSVNLSFKEVSASEKKEKQLGESLKKFTKKQKKVSLH